MNAAQADLLSGWIGAHSTGLSWLLVMSVVSFVASAIAVPVLLARLPADYFVRERSPDAGDHFRAPARVMFRIGRNLLGLALLAAGIAMLVLPGQGVVAILAGLIMLDFPGRHRVERWIVSRPPVLSSINRLRQRLNRPPLIVEV